MSRVGKIPVELPGGVTSTVLGGIVEVSGPRGRLSYSPGRGVKVANEDKQMVVILAAPEDKQARANYGTARAIIQNMVVGVTKGWKRSLELSGVGFTAKVAGSELTLTCGFSHEVKLTIPDGVKCSVNKNTIELESSDREQVGTFAARIRKVQPPEPYLGKGIRFSEEVVRRKAGKTGKK